MSSFVHLIPKTTKANSRIGNIRSSNPKWVDKWLVLEVRDFVSFTDVGGPWLHVQPDCPNSNQFSRWVHEFNDPDFMIAP